MPSFESRRTDPINLPKKIWVIMACEKPLSNVFKPVAFGNLRRQLSWLPRMYLWTLKPKRKDCYVPYSYSNLDLWCSETYKIEHICEFENQLQDILGNWQPSDSLNLEDSQLHAIRDAFELQQAITHVKLSPTYIHTHNNTLYGTFSAASLQSDYIRII